VQLFDGKVVEENAAGLAQGTSAAPVSDRNAASI